MQCERLINLSKNWFLHVKDETMAPARMIQFIKDHVATCDICLGDPDIQDEIEKITELILPESKIPKAVRLQQEKENNPEEEVEEVEAEEEEKEKEETDEEETDEEERDEYIEDDDELEDEDFNELK